MKLMFVMSPFYAYLLLAACSGVLAYPNGSGHCNRGGFSEQRNTFGSHQVKGPGMHTHSAGGVRITVDGQDISTDQIRYLKPNQEYIFRIVFHCNTPFKGFLVRAEGMNNEDLSTAFSALDQHTKACDRCDSKIGAITHKSSSHKNEIQFTFKHTGIVPKIRLDVTVVRNGGRDTEEDPDRAYGWFHDVYELALDTLDHPVAPTPLNPSSALCPTLAPTSSATEPNLALPNIPDSAGYELAYELDIPTNPMYQSAAPLYSVDKHSEFVTFSRVAYYLELDGNYVWTSMDTFTNDARKIGVPCLHLDCGDGVAPTVIQQMITNLNIVSNVPGLTGSHLSGNIEFWPYNYAATNSINIPGASSEAFDFGDKVESHGNFGSMQVHVNGGGSYVGTVFAFNRFNDGSIADLGIGNKPGNVSGLGPDWSFAQNSITYSSRKLKIFALKDSLPLTDSPTASSTPIPTAAPTKLSTEAPTTKSPSVSPSKTVTVSPTKSPSVSPSKTVTVSPTKSPTVSPSKTITVSPTKSPTVSPTSAPTNSPTSSPTAAVSTFLQISLVIFLDFSF